MKILIAGDFCPHDRVAELIEKEHYDDVFCDVKDTIAEADYAVVNFECPVVEHDALPIDKSGPNLRCTAKGVEAVRYAGFQCCTLANNHFADYGDVGVHDTLKALHDKGMDIVGGGRNLTEASETLYKRIGDETLAIINCCEHEFSIAKDREVNVDPKPDRNVNNCTGGSNPLMPIRQYYAIREACSKADRVVVIVHGGHEMYQLPSPRMKETYRFFIDAGADAVVNHHQHCYTGYEEYNGGLIVYGLGNFCFDHKGERHSIWNEGYMITIDFTNEKPSFVLHPYIQCDNTPDIRLMTGEKLAEFNANIQRLNEIIGDDKLLTEKHENWMCKTAGNYISTLQPYTNQYVKLLYVRGLLPSFLNKKNRLSIRNAILCESHHDRMVNAMVHYDEVMKGRNFINGIRYITKRIIKRR